MSAYGELDIALASSRWPWAVVAVGAPDRATAARPGAGTVPYRTRANRSTSAPASPTPPRRRAATSRRPMSARRPFPSLSRIPATRSARAAATSWSCHQMSPRRISRHSARPTVAHRRAGRVRHRRCSDERRGGGIRAVHDRNPARLGRHRPLRSGRLRLRLRRRFDGAIRDRRLQLGITRSGAVHADRHQSRLPRARHLPGGRDRGVCGIRRLRIGHVATRHRTRHGVDRRLRRAGRRSTHGAGRQDLRENPRGPGC